MAGKWLAKFLDQAQEQDPSIPAGNEEKPPQTQDLRGAKGVIGLGLNQEADAKSFHDDTLLQLAADCPTRCYRWGQEHRWELWARIKDDYAKIRELFLLHDYQGAVEHMQAWAGLNRQLFDMFLKELKLKEMPTDEAEELIMKIFNATPVNILRE